jgi:hypothetical protein
LVPLWLPPLLLFFSTVGKDCGGETGGILASTVFFGSDFFSFDIGES